jgi:general secretion pathway protein I
LSHAAVSSTHRATAGFTIIEAMVALAIVAVSVVAIGTVMGLSAQHVTLVQAAYNVLLFSYPSRWRDDAEIAAVRTLNGRPL